MHREQATGQDGDHIDSEPSPPQSAVVLVGEAAREHRRIDALLSANHIVILLPSLQTAHSLLTPSGEWRQTAALSERQLGDLLVDLTEHRVLWGERELLVSERELAVLATLSEEPGRARTFAELAEPEGGQWLGDTERVHSSIKRLRKKLAEAGVEARIESVHGYGFRLASRATGRPRQQSGPAHSSA